MSFDTRKIILSVLVLCSLQTATKCAINQTMTRIIPVRSRNNFPVTHERIIVPVAPIDRSDQVEKPVTEPVESNVRRRGVKKHRDEEDAPVKPRQQRNPKNFDDGKGNFHKAYSYVSRTDDKPKEAPSRRNITKERAVKETPRTSRSFDGDEEEEIQPLHINTQVFKKRMPQNSAAKPTGKYQSKKPNPNDIHEMKPNEKDSRHKLKLDKLPQNPTEIPETTWFDNLGKYSYGIFHDEIITEPPEYSNNQQQSVTASQESHVESLTPKVFKSSFRGPNQIQPPAGPLGKFLYKTEVLYPAYRNDIYAPVITYGDYYNHPATKELPTLNVHLKASSPATPIATTTETPQSESEKPVEPKQVEEKQAEDEEAEDYDEDDSEDEDDGASNDRYDGDAPGDDEEEENDRANESESEEDDSPRYRYSYNDDDSSRSDESDQFDRAWAKYGYGRGNDRSDSDEDSGSYESSETQQNPKIIKYHHEKKEQITMPLKLTTEAPVQLKRVAKVMSGSLNNNNKSHPKIPQKPTSVKSQVDEKQNSPKSNAASDDLKYFQYFNYLGNGIHTSGGRSGNDNHYIEQHERGNKALGMFQKKVRWADKEGGFGEHYWDLNH